MADYEQVSSVNIKAMGKKKGWCLQNWLVWICYNLTSFKKDY